jgi:acetylornithine deacetylase/succinyl-diaminopimelate desuccinylase-like protein
MIKTVDRLGKEEAEESGCLFSYRILSYHPPVATISLSKWCSRLAKASRLLGGDGVIRGMTPYSTDAVSFSPIIDVPILICGPGSIKQAHQPNEFIDIEQIAQALEIMTALIA